MQDTNYCARHPDTETNLRCGRCDTLVCPQCLVHLTPTAAGLRLFRNIASRAHFWHGPLGQAC